jgi:hypothetical protein
MTQQPLCMPGTQSMGPGFGQCGPFNQSQVFNTRPFGYMGQPDRSNTLGRRSGASTSGLINGMGFGSVGRQYGLMPARSHHEMIQHSVPKFVVKQQMVTNGNEMVMMGPGVERFSRSNLRNNIL